MALRASRWSAGESGGLAARTAPSWAAVGLGPSLLMRAARSADGAAAVGAGLLPADKGEVKIRDIKLVDGKVFIYYASSDTRLHVATTTVDQLVDYCLNTPSDELTSSASVARINALVDKNEKHA